MNDIIFLKEKINNSNFTDKEELLNKLNNIENNLKNKKYGLVWEDKLENVKEDLKDKFIYLIEETDKRIIENEGGTENLLIEGDNLESLMALQYTHKGKVDVIYIDPPYNTGNKDFIYNDKYVDEKTYPVEMSNYILDYFKETGFYNVRIFNEYNYGSYLLYRGIPVFIDSRADLYSPEFNSGVNVFEDSESVGSFEMDIDEFVEKYNITHIILSNQSQLNKVLKKIEGTKYKLIKEDENFSFYKIENL